MLPGLSRAALPAALLGIVLTGGPAAGCGFWGDGDIGMIAGDYESSAPSPERTSFMSAARLPGGDGYALAVDAAGRARPYGMAFDGDVVPDPQRLVALGYRVLVDLAPEAGELPEHRRVSAEAGIGYHPVPIAGLVPDAADLLALAALVNDPARRPMILFAEDARHLTLAWAAVLTLSAGLSETLRAAAPVGLDADLERELVWQVRNGKYAALGIAP